MSKIELSMYDFLDDWNYISDYKKIEMRLLRDIRNCEIFSSEEGMEITKKIKSFNKRKEFEVDGKTLKKIVEIMYFSQDLLFLKKILSKGVPSKKK